MTPIDPAPLNVVPPHAEESEPVTEPEQAEATAPDAEVDESAADTEPEEPALTPEQNRAALYAKLADLDASYDAISDQQTEGAEITPLRTEYSTLRDEARSITDDAGMVRLAEYADARIALLSLRAEVQIARTQLAELEEQADANRSAIQSTREGIMRARGYEMVGVLTRSSLYTGGALPLRFRLQSSSSVIARTIAYIEPKEGTDLAPLLGKQVGVIVALDGVTRTGPVPILRAEVVESVNLDEPAGNR